MDEQGNRVQKMIRTGLVLALTGGAISVGRFVDQATNSGSGTVALYLSLGSVATTLVALIFDLWNPEK